MVSPAKTYRIASSLVPSLVLNPILNIPAFLISLRNSLLTTQPFVRPSHRAPGAAGPLSQGLGLGRGPASAPAPALTSGSGSGSGSTASEPSTHARVVAAGTPPSPKPQSHSESSAESSASEAEADVESNAGVAGDRMVESSWISLPKESESVVVDGGQVAYS